MERNDFFKGILDNLYDGVYFLDRNRRITYWNSGAERITGYSLSDVRGKRCADNILIHVDGKGRSLCERMCPTAETLSDGREREAEVYVHHREGHRVPVHVRISPLRDEEGRIVGAVEVFSENSEWLAARQRIVELQGLAMLDVLTEVGNRRYGEIRIRERLNELRRYRWPFGVIFIDLDNFKRINDRYGHAAGDRVLRMIARTVTYSLRASDSVCRWGGEEFLVLVGNVDGKGLCAVAERIRALAEQSGLPTEKGTARVTVSAGATLARSEDDGETLVARADGLMYRSKEAGRNCVTCDEGITPSRD